MRKYSLCLAFLTVLFVGACSSTKEEEGAQSDSSPKAQMDKAQMTKEQVIADTQQLENHLRNNFAYLKVDSDYDAKLTAQLNAMRAKGAMSVDDFILRVNQTLGLFIDGHSSAFSFGMSRPTAYAPFLIEPMNDDTFVAFNAGRESFVVDGYPYLKAIDGVSIDKWVAVISSYFPKGTKIYQSNQSVRFIRSYIQRTRQLLNLPMSSEITLTLENSDKQTTTKTLALSDRRGYLGRKFDYKSVVMEEENIGYLKIEKMDNDLLPELVKLMPTYKNTDGLIIDVRGNGGGSRGILDYLFPYFMKAGEKHIANVAKYRLAKEFKEDHLEARYLFRKSHFSTQTQNFIAAFEATFQPQWTPPKDDFSQWHYMVIEKSEDDGRYHYDKPVVILIDGGVFSATDIFVGAFKGWRNVTLVGQPTMGGSARSQSYDLEHSETMMKLASMASFQPDGKLYDGNGILPDKVIEPIAQDFLKVEPYSDSVFIQAKQYLLEKMGK